MLTESGIYRRGKVWWIRYSRRGKQHFESSRSTKKTDALRLLALRRGQVVEGKWPGSRVERVLFDELAQDLLNDYKVNRRRSLKRLRGCLGHLQDFFGGMRAVEITTDRIKEYIVRRLEEPTHQGERPTNATINRELAALKRMFSLGAKASPPKVLRVPYIPKLREDNVREGFFTMEEYRLIKAALPIYLCPLVTVGFWTGMRLGELLDLHWEQVDLKEGSIRLEPGSTKNERGRTVYLPREVVDELGRQKDERDLQFPDCPWVFHREGKRVRDIRAAWQNACKRVGLEGKLFHDLRRTGVRNLIRAGVPEKVAMEISGHRTRCVFDRYNIVRPDDLKAAARALDFFYASDQYKTNTIEQAEQILRDAKTQTTY